MKVAIIAGAVFAVSLAGSTVFTLSKKEPARTGEHASDSMAQMTGDSAAPDGAAADDTAAAEPEIAALMDIGDGNMSELAALIDGAVIDTITDDPEPVAPETEPEAEPLLDDPFAAPEIDPEEAARLAEQERRAENTRQLARIFGSMQAQEAAEVMGHMNNSEIVDVLGYLGSRKAGQVMAAFSGARAATISRMLLEAEQR